MQKETADLVARHLVAAGQALGVDPELALRHARYARQRASRIAVVREAAGIAAYQAGEWSEALSDLRAARRMGGGPGHLAVIADIERALGRPERAVEIARGPEAKQLDTAAAMELLIVLAGARRDLGELDAAVVTLQVPELDPERRDPWSPRLFYAYADNLLAAGRTSDAVQWFARTVDADDAGETDAADRIADLTGEPRAELDVDFLSDDAPEIEAEPDSDSDDAVAATVPESGTAEESEAGETAAIEDPEVDDAAAVPATSDGTTGSDTADAAHGAGSAGAAATRPEPTVIREPSVTGESVRPEDSAVAADAVPPAQVPTDVSALPAGATGADGAAAPADAAFVPEPSVADVPVLAGVSARSRDSAAGTDTEVTDGPSTVDPAATGIPIVDAGTAPPEGAAGSEVPVDVDGRDAADDQAEDRGDTAGETSR